MWRGSFICFLLKKKKKKKRANRIRPERRRKKKKSVKRDVSWTPNIIVTADIAGKMMEGQHDNVICWMIAVGL